MLDNQPNTSQPLDTPTGQTNTLVVGPSWVGDMVMAQSLFKTLKEQSSASNIDVIAPAWSVPVLQRMPEVRQAIALDTAHGELGIKKRYRLGKSLRGEYQRAIILPRSLKSALVPFFAQVPIRTGFKGEARFGLINDIREFDKAHLNQTVKRFTALGLSSSAAKNTFAIDNPQLQIDSDAQQDCLKKFELDPVRPAIALFPGAEYGPAKQWPLAYFRELAQNLVDEGFQVWVMGSQKDYTAGEAIVGKATVIGRPRYVINCCGKTSIAEVIDLIAYCKAAVSNDSGLMHVAAAADCPVVGIYGSSSPEFTPPLSARAKILYLNLDCSPCFKRECPLQHLNCLHNISPQNVFSNLKELLSTQ
ncbi:MAG: heptosyltransferase-2 [Pseudohongiellaceae bacterium]|jgi:heptosyltransferase-2